MWLHNELHGLLVVSNEFGMISTKCLKLILMSQNNLPKVFYIEKEL